MFRDALFGRQEEVPAAISPAYHSMTVVRKRAGLGDLPSSATANAEAFLDALLTERGHEMLYEGMRKIDLIRFNQYAQRTAKIKGVAPTHQYVPIPNYAVQQASESYGKVLVQTFERECLTQVLGQLLMGEQAVSKTDVRHFPPMPAFPPFDVGNRLFQHGGRIFGTNIQSERQYHQNKQKFPHSVQFLTSTSNVQYVCPSP